MTAKLPVRHLYEVLPPSKNERWSGVVFRWEVTKDGDVITRTWIKSMAVRFAVAAAKEAWLNLGEHGTLKIKGRNGVIQDERTYGADPRKTKG